MALRAGIDARALLRAVCALHTCGENASKIAIVRAPNTGATVRSPLTAGVLSFVALVACGGVRHTREDASAPPPEIHRLRFLRRRRSRRRTGRRPSIGSPLCALTTTSCSPDADAQGPGARRCVQNATDAFACRVVTTANGAIAPACEEATPSGTDGASCATGADCAEGLDCVRVTSSESVCRHSCCTGACATGSFCDLGELVGWAREAPVCVPLARRAGRSNRVPAPTARRAPSSTR